MNEQELITRLQDKAKETAEFASHQKATMELFVFLDDFVPKDKTEMLGDLLHEHGVTAGNMAQKMLQLAEELAEEE